MLKTEGIKAAGAETLHGRQKIKQPLPAPAILGSRLQSSIAALTFLFACCFTVQGKTCHLSRFVSAREKRLLENTDNGLTQCKAAPCTYSQLETQCTKHIVQVLHILAALNKIIN